MKPNTVPIGPHPHRGFGQLPSRPDIFRCKLRPEASKARPEYADYAGVLNMDSGRKALVRLWCHQDGSLGLRLELNPQKRKAT